MNTNPTTNPGNAMNARNALFALLTLITVACGGDTGFQGLILDDQPTADAGNDEFDYCIADADCASGETCNSQGICTMPGEDGRNGRDAELPFHTCTDDSDCSGTESCNSQGLCLEPGEDGADADVCQTVDHPSNDECILVQCPTSRAEVCNGQDGRDGLNGENGEPGTPGADGANGESCTAKIVEIEGRSCFEMTCGGDVVGIAGCDGIDGDDGENGRPGTPGADGQNGENGEDGTDGLSCAVISRDGCNVVACEDGSESQPFACAPSQCSDSDADGVCDVDDVCASGNDTIDTDADGIPNACDDCPTDATNTCGDPVEPTECSLTVRDGWNIGGIVGHPVSYTNSDEETFTVPSGDWEHDMTTLTWSGGDVASLNTETEEATEQEFGIRGEKRFNDDGTFRDYCGNPQVDESMFVGDKPSDLGCTVECVTGRLSWQCPECSL